MNVPLPAAAEGYLRFPSVHGEHVAFTAEDDVWLAPLTGGRAWRLTDSAVPVAGARLSPDGAHVAFTSTVDGVPEVWCVPTAGGSPRRLTWWGDRYVAVVGWLDAGHVIATSAVGEPFRSRTWARAVPLDGGPARRLPVGPVTGWARSASGTTAVTTGSDRRDYSWWKRYRGGTASTLWLDAGGPDPFTATAFAPLATGVGGAGEPATGPLSGQVVAPMWVGERLTFLSDHEGHGNVYSCLPDGRDLRRHTDHTGAYARQATTDGRRVVYAVAGRLHLLEDLTADSQPQPLAVRTGGSRGARAPSPLSAKEVGEALGAVAPDRTGRASAVEVRGTVHWLTSREGPSRVLAAEAGVRARSPQVLGDADVVWVTDAEGDDALEVAPVTGRPAGAPPRRLAVGRLGRVLDLAAAPDGSTVAVACADGRLVVVDVATGTDRVVATTSDDAPRDLAFSPDSAWLAFSSPTREPLAGLRLVRLAHDEPADDGPADDEVVEVTPERFTDTEPVFTLDGAHLAFLSRRTFDPVYDEHVFDLSFPVSTRPYLLPLAATTPSPFAPQREGRPSSGPAPALRPAPAGDAGDARDAGGDGPAPVVVDVEGLAQRVVPVPVEAARCSSLRAVTGGLVWLRHPLTGELGDGRARPGDKAPRAVLERLDLVTGRTSTIAEGVDAVEVSGDGTHLVVRDGGDLRVIPSDRRVADDEDDPARRVEVDLSRVRVVVDPAAQWRQMFAEAGRLRRDHFWVADLAGVDWDDVLDRYRPLLDRIATRDDLVDVLWEVNGELGTSHAYVVPPAAPSEDERRLGMLGADLARSGDGRWRIERVLAPESSDVRARSPLAAPGVAVGAGDVLLAVDGVPVPSATGPGPLLVGTAEHPVELLVEPAGGGQPRAVVVVPLREEMPLRYQEWVAGRRSAVRAATGGRVGYLHVPDMVSNGWAQLHRDLRTEVTRDALVLDVRDNNGGHTSQLVVERLARTVLAWGMGRGWQPETYPTDARRGPLVCVTDENAGSDGDIVTAVVQQRALGPVVGARTWGGVVGIDGRYTLVDGTAVTQPRYAFWFPGQAWGVENHGVDPDVPVAFAPHDWAAGRDPQLDRAVAVVTDALASHPAAQPPDVATRPSRVAPALPPRPAAPAAERPGEPA